MTADLSQHPDDTIRNLWAKASAEEAELKSLYKRAQTTLPPTPAELRETLKTSDDARVAEYREALFKAQAALQSLEEEANAYILSGYQTVSPEEAEQIKATFKAKRTAVITILNLIKSIAVQLGIEDVVGVIDQYEVPNLRGATTASNSGSGPRARISAIEVAKDGEVLKRWDDDKARLSVAALFMKVGHQDVITAWMDAAGTATWQEIKDVVTFDVTNPTSGITYSVTIEPEKDQVKGQDNALEAVVG